MPILKKHGLDPSELSNRRPISNLSFLSKLLEQVVANQLQNYLANNNLFKSFQAGLYPLQSTETALVKVTNDLLLSADSATLSILIILYLSATFDTVNHHVLFFLSVLRWYF